MKHKRRIEKTFNEQSTIYSENESKDSFILTERNANNLKDAYNIFEFNDEQQDLLENIQIEDLIEDLKNPKLEDKYLEEIDTTCPLFKENNFILSKKSKEKCNKVYHYMKYQVPCILEGETGTSKSFTASMMAKYRQWKIIEDEKKKSKKQG